MAFSSVPIPFMAFLNISASVCGLKGDAGKTEGVGRSCKRVNKFEFKNGKNR